MPKIKMNPRACERKTRHTAPPPPRNARRAYHCHWCDGWHERTDHTFRAKPKRETLTRMPKRRENTAFAAKLKEAGFSETDE